MLVCSSWSYRVSSKPCHLKIFLTNANGCKKYNKLACDALLLITLVIGAVVEDEEVSAELLLWQAVVGMKVANNSKVEEQSM